MAQLRLASSEDTVTAGSCSVALRVFDKLSPTLSVQSVSLSNTPSEALLSNAMPRVQPFPPALAGVFLSRLGTSPETRRGIEQPIPLFQNT